MFLIGSPNRFFGFFCLFVCFFKRGEGRRKRGRETLVCGCLLPQGDPAPQACALDWELNQQPFGYQTSTKSTEPHQPGHEALMFLLPVVGPLTSPAPQTVGLR